MKHNGRRRKNITLVLPLLLALSGTGASADNINGLRLWDDNQQTRIVFDSRQKADINIFKLDNPHRLVVDFINEPDGIAADLVDAPLNGAPIKNIRLGRQGNNSRVVFDIAQGFTFESFTLGRMHGKPYRHVIDLRYPGKQAVVASPSITIAIDAGHGGRDPGAIGPAGTYEKDVVLPIAREIVRQLNATDGFAGVLTRKRDRYIGLRERTRIARRHDVDAFVSIHADAARRRSAQGGSVYVLSSRGASSETAKWLAKGQNQAVTQDDIAFLKRASDRMTRETLLDLSMTRSLSTSITLGESILEALDDEISLHKDYVGRANFAVLRSPDVPSLLVETGFLSNPAEEQKLIQPAHQRRLATQITRALVSYFSHNPT